jgi:succinate dehydrogenase/fumarate reductase flavoprotein subunit
LVKFWPITEYPPPENAGDNRMHRTLSESSRTYDVAVLGAGAGGLSAAISAALEGARVLLVERCAHLGGTAAFSAGTTWIPLTRHSVALGANDSYEKVSRFLERAVGNQSSAVLRNAFLAAGPGVIDTLEDKTDVKFRARPFHPDYMYELAYSAKLIARYYLGKMRHGRGTRLVMGNALIGRMLMAALKLDVTILTETETTSLVMSGTSVTGVRLRQKGIERQIDVAGGVILASGGFAQHKRLRPEKLPRPLPEFSPSAPGSTGALHDLAFAAGAFHGETASQPCFWAPVSRRRRKDGSMAVFPHFVFDRSKPGIISVGRDGRRFVNESTSYHRFVSAMYAINKEGSHIPVYLVADARALKTYGLGMIRPGGAGIRPFLADGYLTEGKTPEELAAKLGIDAEGLKDSLARMSSYGKTGADTDFARGTTVYEKANGDPAHGPNPSLGALDTPPFYAIRLWPGDIGSATGLVGDEHGRLLRRDGSVIEGLYACGNDLQSIMGGAYPGPGITIGPAIVFGALSGRHSARRRVASGSTGQDFSPEHKIGARAHR